MSKQVTKRYKLNYFDIDRNSNKVWEGIAYSDGTFKSRWGRVVEGANLASNEKNLGSSSAAETELENKKREKIAKGYKDSQVFDDEIIITTTPGGNLKNIAVKEIGGADDVTTLELLEYLAEVNIHNITASTSIKYNAANATFSTPLGVLTPTAVADARDILAAIDAQNSSGDPNSILRTNKIRDYFQLVPKDFGRKIPEASELLNSQTKIQKENDILDAIESAISNAQNTKSGEPIFKCRLTKIPHWTPEGRNEFRRIRSLFESTKNINHGYTSTLKLKRIYEVEIEDMKANFDKCSAKLGNVRSDLWHGTKASNLLSILRSGLIIPPRSSAHCTGRMFGNGIYTSNQSTKALNYATSMWNRSGQDKQRTFMFLCDTALGKTHKPGSYNSNLPAKGTDSTWVEAGTAGVMNHECIVYSVDRINLRYLCEFGE
jgi:poly [ADP-ribose] polymerase 2/3/4